MKKIFLYCFFIISCTTNKPENMQNLTLDITPTSKWACSQNYTPSDIIQISTTEWAVLNSQNYYLLLKEASEILQNTVAGVGELVRLEKMNDVYIAVNYDATSRTNKAWTNASISLEGKQDLNLDDPADILYSELTKKLYWIHSSRALFVYDFETKNSTPFLSNQTASDFSISKNGMYLATQDSDENISVISLKNNEIVQKYSSKEGQTNSLVGVTNEGKVLVVNLHVAEKNSSKTFKNQVTMLDGTNENPVLSINSGWARLVGTNLIAWADNEKGEKEFQLFDIKEALK